MAWLDPEKHKEDHAYQIWQSLLAFGSGGLEGMGLGSGRIKINFLPEQQTDFIFAVIGEEMGLFSYSRFSSCRAFSLPGTREIDLDFSWQPG